MEFDLAISSCEAWDYESSRMEDDFRSFWDVDCDINGTVEVSCSKNKFIFVVSIVFIKRGRSGNFKHRNLER